MKQGVFPPGHTLRQGQFGVKQMHSHVNPPRPLLTEPPLLGPLRYFTPALSSRVFPAPGVRPALLIF